MKSFFHLFRPCGHLAVLAALVAALSACGGGGGDEAVAAAPAPAPAPSPTPVPSPAPAPLSAGITFLAGSAATTGNLDGKGREAYFNRPAGISLAADGTLWVADSSNFTVRKVSADGSVSTVAGGPGIRDAQDGIGAAARFQGPVDIAAAPDGSAYLIDQGRLRRVAADSAVTTLLTGHYSSVSVAPDGTVYLATATAIYRWSAAAGAVPVAGREGVSDVIDGPSATAAFLQISDIAVDAQRNIYVAEPRMQTLRKVDAAGNVTTFAGGQGTAGHVDGTGTAARFSGPVVLSLDAAGNVWVGERGFGSFRRVTPAGMVTSPFGSDRPLFDFQSAITLAAGSAGDVWFGAGLGINRLDAAGVLTPLVGQDFVPDPPLRNAGGLGVDAAGNVMIADAIYGPGSFSTAYELTVITPAGQVRKLPQVFSIDQSTAGFGFGPDGSVYFGAVDVTSLGINAFGAVGGTLYRMSPDGAIAAINTWPPGSPDRLAPANLILGRDGAFYFVDAITNNVVRLSAAGRTVLANLGPLQNLFGQSPRVLAADATGRAYVVMPTAVYRADGGVLTLVAGHATEQGVVDGTGGGARFVSARSAAVDRDGNLYVGDREVVRKMTPAGLVTTVAGQRGFVGLRSGALPATLGAVGRIAVGDDGVLYVVSGASALVKIRLPSP